jgi:hypothetical protein
MVTDPPTREERNVRNRHRATRKEPRRFDGPRPRGLLAAAFLLATSPGGLAQTALVEALVTVPDSSNQARIEAIPRALDQVFDKLSGHRSAASSPERKDELARAALAVHQYQYRLSPSGGPMTLWVLFDEQAVAEAAWRAGVEVWRGPRPEPLVWPLARSEGRLEVVDPELLGDVSKAIDDAAWRRGLRVRLPLLDLEERSRLTAQALASDTERTLLEASERYPTGPVTVAQIGSVDSHGGRIVDWLMLDGGSTTRWRSRGGSVTEALVAGADALVDVIATRYATGRVSGATGGEESTVVDVTVTGIGSGGDYGRVMAYLRALPGVTSFKMLPAAGNVARFRVALAGGADRLRELVSVGDTLEAGASLSEYRLRP